MKAIKITQEIKDKNAKYGISWVNTGTVGDYVKRNLPNKFHVTEPVSGYYHTRTDLHEADGWRDIIMPQYNTSTHKLGVLIYDEENDNFTYEVLALTEEEIRNRALSDSESEKAQKINDFMQSMVLAEAYNETDIPTILENTSLYPLFEVGVEVWNSADAPNGIPTRVKDFNNDNELVLWEAIQSHITQGDWRPKDVPALFKRVAEDGEIPDFIQPTGAHDAYQTGDRVMYNGQVWESTIDNNVWSPDTYPQGWQLI